MDDLNQAKGLIEKSHNILIVPARQIQGDVLGSALALFFTLKKLRKNVNIKLKKVPERLQFLIDSQPASFKNFVISIDTSGRELSEMRYEKNEKSLKIYLALNKGSLTEKDIDFSAFGQNPDLLITLGMKSLEGLDYDRTPILNIDNQSLNENFGQVNLIETTFSLSETSTNLIKSIEDEWPQEEVLLDKNIATCLLTGIVCASQNFRSSKAQPETFKTSAFLMEKGADHQKIIQYLYKQKNISQVKLLGRILEKLSFNEGKELYSSSITEQDFQDCQARPRDLSFVIEELKFNFRYLANLLILWESHASPVLIRGVFYSQKLDMVKKILENYEGISKGKGALFSIKDSDLNSAKEKILKVI